MVAVRTSLWISLIVLFQFCTSSQVRHCCTYCRAEQSLWMSSGTKFHLSGDVEETAMQSPAAMMVHDREEVGFSIEGRQYRLSYAGAPLIVKYENLNDAATVQREQYMQVDLAEPKLVGGILTQGGFYEEKLQNLFPKSITWVTEFALSASNDSYTFHWVKSDRGSIKLFDGNTDADTAVLASFDLPVTARYFRYHPLRAQDKEGAVSNVNVRISVTACMESGCAYPQISCLMSQWSQWTACEANTHSRKRGVIRVQSCGGERCGTKTESRSCTPPVPLWQAAMPYMGAGLGALLIIMIIAFIIYKKTHKDRVEVIVVKENDDDDDDVPPPPMARPGMGPGMGGPRGPGGFGMRPGAPGGFAARPMGPAGMGGGMGGGRFPGPGGGGVRFAGQAGGVAPVAH